MTTKQTVGLGIAFVLVFLIIVFWKPITNFFSSLVGPKTGKCTLDSGGEGTYINGTCADSGHAPGGGPEGGNPSTKFSFKTAMQIKSLSCSQLQQEANSAQYTLSLAKASSDNISANLLQGYIDTLITEQNSKNCSGSNPMNPTSQV